MTNQSLIDKWTLGHILIGYGLGKKQISFPVVIGVAILYEIIEQKIESGPNPFGTKQPESLKNVIADLAIMSLAYYVAAKPR